MGSGKLRVEGYGFLVEGGHTAMSVWVVWDTKWGRLPTSRETPCSTRKLYRVQGLGFLKQVQDPTWQYVPGSDSLHLTFPRTQGQRKLKPSETSESLTADKLQGPLSEHYII